MEWNANHIAAGGGALAVLAALWVATRGFLRNVRERGEWKGRIEQQVQQNGAEIAALRTQTQNGFEELRGIITDHLQQQRS